MVVDPGRISPPRGEAVGNRVEGDSAIEITWLGHSTVVLDIGGVRIISDPLLRPHAGLLRRRGAPPRAADWTGAVAVLLSHLHHDHADLRSLRLLGDVPVFTAHHNAQWLRAQGLNGIGLDEGTWTDIGMDAPGVA